MEKNSWIVVITTLITVGGTVAIALINRPTPKSDDVKPPVVDGGDGTKSGEQAVPPAPPPNNDPVKLIETPAPVPAPVPVPVPVSTSPVAGAWHDYLHRNYTIAVNGSVAQLTGPEFPSGMMAAVAGTGIQWNFSQPNGNQGTCGGTVTGDQLNIMCNSMAGSMPFPLHRPGT